MYKITDGGIYQENIAILKAYTDDYYKIVGFRSVKVAGVDGYASYKREKVDEGRFDESISRARSAIHEIVMCNDFEYFVTMTLDKRHHDRYDLDVFRKRLAKWINNYNTKEGVNIKYLLIPERHKDGAYHCHGFLADVPGDHLYRYGVNSRLPYAMLKLIKQGRALYNWPAYAKAFGFVSLEKIKDKERAARYVMKYVSKELGSVDAGANKHLYYCSKGLNRSREVWRGELTKVLEPDFKNEYVSVKTVDSFEAGISYFTERVDGEGW